MRTMCMSGDAAVGSIFVKSVVFDVKSLVC